MIVTPSAAITAAAAAKPNERPVVGLPAVLLLEPLFRPPELLLELSLELLLELPLEVPLEVLLELSLEVLLELSLEVLLELPLEVSLEVVPEDVLSLEVPPLAVSELSEPVLLPVLPVMPFTMLRPAFAAPSTISSPALTAPFTAPPIAEPTPVAEAAEVSAAKQNAAAAAAEIFLNIAILLCN